MNMTRDRVQSIVWAIVIATSAALLLALTFRVNAVKSQVRLTERRIVAIQQEKQSLDTEFQTRANQQQLVAINAVEFGLKAPTAAQYVDGERRLAALSVPVAPAFTPGLPSVVRMANADVVAVPTPPQAGGSDRNVVTRVAVTGSLPRVLGPLANRTLAVGGGTRLLSDHDEVRGKPGTPSSPGRLAKSINPLTAHLASRDLPARKLVPADVAHGKSAAARPVPERLVMSDDDNARLGVKASKR